MQALVLENWKDYSSLVLKEVEIPEPKKCEVLIKIERAPIYNYDMLSIHTKTPKTGPAYLIPGIEGTGTVIKSGGGIKSWLLLGKKISFVQLDDSYAGSWAEYAVCNSKWCKPIEEIENSSTILLYNSLIAKMAIDTARKGNYSGIILTSADSITGKILLKLALSCKIKCICIVEEKFKKIELKHLGANIVLRPSKDNFSSKLKKLCDDLNPLCTFDTRGGKLIHQIVPIIRSESEIYIIDNDSNSQLSGINPSDLIFGGKKIKGLDLKKWIKGLSLRQQLCHFEDIFKEKEIFQVNNNLDLFSFSDFKNGIINCMHNKNNQSILYIGHIKEENKENENSEEKKQEKIEINNEDSKGEEIEENQLEESKEEDEPKKEEIEEEDEENEEQIYLESEIQNYESRTVTKLLQTLPKFEWDYQLNDGIETKEMPLRQLPDLSIYKGEWANDTPHGKGTRYYTDGSIYIGYWQNGQSNGKGLFINSDGEWYEGMWKESKFNGLGKHYTQEGQYYEGIFEDNFIQKGTEITFDGNKYEGTFINNEWNGFGCLIIKETEMKYEGEFVKGNISGKGKLFYKDWKIFQGEFQWFNATGTMIYPDGTIFEGKIFDCKEDGEGKLIDTNGEAKIGIWKEGEFIQWVDENKEEIPNKENEAIEEQKEQNNEESKQTQEVDSADKKDEKSKETEGQNYSESSEDKSKAKEEEENSQSIENPQES